MVIFYKGIYWEIVLYSEVIDICIKRQHKIETRTMTQYPVAYNILYLHCTLDFTVGISVYLINI